jgi:hypothetical protein
MLNIPQRQERYRRFYQSHQPGQILILCNYAGGPSGQAVDFRQYDFTRIDEHRRYWNVLIANTRAAIADRADLDDDWMPGVEAYYGFGSFGAVYCDAPLTFTGTTSYIEPVLERLDDIDALDLAKERFWARLFVEAARYLSQKSEGRFMVSAYPNPSPLDVANLLRGNAIFTDVYEQPKQFHHLLERCLAGAITNMRRIAQVTTNPGGGTFAFNRWIPQGALLLEDAADLISPKLYRTIGMPYTQRMIDEAGGAYLHHHSLGRHQYANMAGLRGLYVEQISSDPAPRRPVTEAEEVFARVGTTDSWAGVAVDLECTPGEVYDNIAALQKGKVILSVDTANKAEAQQLLAFVRARSQG